MNLPITLVISGQVGAGKSTAAQELAKFFESQGRIVKIISLDEVGHRVLAESGLVKAKLHEFFGTDIVDEYGRVSRKKVAEKAFDSVEHVKMLNSATHPAIAQAALQEVTSFRQANLEGIVIIETPFPASYLQRDGHFSSLAEPAITIAIIADREVRRARKDTLSLEDFDRRDALQEPADTYTDDVDYVLNNSAGVEPFRSVLVERGREILQ